MRLDNQDINGVIPLIKKGIDKYFHIKIDVIKLFINNDKIYFDGQGSYKGISFKLDGNCTITLNHDCFVLSFHDAIIRSAFMNIELDNFIKQFLKQDNTIFYNNNKLYIRSTISPIPIKINEFQIINNEIKLSVSVLS